MVPSGKMQENSFLAIRHFFDNSVPNTQQRLRRTAGGKVSADWSIHLAPPGFVDHDHLGLAALAPLQAAAF